MSGWVWLLYKFVKTFRFSSEIRPFLFLFKDATRQIESVEQETYKLELCESENPHQNGLQMKTNLAANG